MNSDGASLAGLAVIAVLGLIYLGVIVFTIITLWKVFAKAGEPGWACLVPFYNGVVMCKVGGKPGWWFVLLLLPVVNIVVSILVSLGVAERFGKGGGFGVGLILLPFIFYPILAFGSSQYIGPKGV